MVRSLTSTEIDPVHALNCFSFKFLEGTSTWYLPCRSVQIKSFVTFLVKNCCLFDIQTIWLMKWVPRRVFPFPWDTWGSTQRRTKIDWQAFFTLFIFSQDANTLPHLPQEHPLLLQTFPFTVSPPLLLSTSTRIFTSDNLFFTFSGG